MLSTLLFVWILFMLLIGLVAVIAAYLAYRAPEHRPGDPLTQFPRGIAQGHGPIPILMWLLYVAIACALVGYTLWVWLTHPNL